MVCETFYQFENVESVIMVPGKSYSFVKFKDEVSAMKAFNDVSGKIIWSNIKGPVHLDYVKDFNPTLLKQSKIFKNPPELILIDDFITEEEEEFILGLVGFNDDNEEGNSSQLKHRKVKHFGYEFKYSTNNVDLNEPIEKIPTELSFLWERLKKYSNEHNCNINFVPDQLTINCYEPGQGIPPHVDTHSAFEDGILSLSLQSCIVMEFKNESGTSYNVILKRRSLCIMLGESRFELFYSLSTS